MLAILKELDSRPDTISIEDFKKFIGWVNKQHYSVQDGAYLHPKQYAELVGKVKALTRVKKEVILEVGLC